MNDILKLIREYMKTSMKVRYFVYLGTLAISIVAVMIYMQITRGDRFITAEIIFILVLFAMLVDIGISMKNKHKRKKYIVYVGMFTTQILVMVLVSLITDVGVGNTWLGAIGVGVIFITFGIMLFDVSVHIKTAHNSIATFLNFVAMMIVGGAIISNIVFFMGL